MYQEYFMNVFKIINAIQLTKNSLNHTVKLTSIHLVILIFIFKKVNTAKMLQINVLTIIDAQVQCITWKIMMIIKRHITLTSVWNGTRVTTNKELSQSKSTHHRMEIMRILNLQLTQTVNVHIQSIKAKIKINVSIGFNAMQQSNKIVYII